MPNPLDTLYDQLKGQYPDLVDRSEFIGKLHNEDELKKLHDAASKDIPGFVDFDNFKSKVGESLSTYEQDSDHKAQSAPADQESAPTDITIPRREKGRHVPQETQNGGIDSETHVPAQPVQPIDTHVDAEPFDRETGDLDELGRRYEDKAKRLEGYGREPNLYVNEAEARKHYEAYSRLYDEAEQDRLVYNRRVKAADDERAEQQRQSDLQSKDRKTRRAAEYGGYTNDQVRKEQERLKKERAYLEDPKSRRKADYSRRVMEYNADQTALSGEADKRNKRAESKRKMYDEVKKVAEDPDVQKRITGNDTVTYVLSGNNPYALQNYDAARQRAKTMSIEELADTCKTIAGQKYARGDNKDIYAPLAASFMAYHNELMYRLGGDEPKSALEMRYDMIDKVTESSPEGDNFMLTLRNYLDGTAGMGTANFENDQRERANIPQFAVVDYFNNLLAQKEAENMGKVEQISRYPQQGGVTELSVAAAAMDYNYDAMLQQAFDRFGDGNLKAYITAYALRNGISVDEAARRVNQSIWDETIGKVMEESRPKSNLEFFLRRITSDNMFAKLMQLSIRARNNTLGSTDPFMVNSTVLDEYAKDHPGWDTAAVVTNFAVMEGPIFSAYGKLAGGLVGATERAIIGAATKTAEKTAIESSVKALNQSFWYRLAKGVPTGGLVGFQYGTMSGAIDQAYYDGNVNFGKVIANGLHTTRDFAIMHGVGEVFGVTGDAILRRGQRNLRPGQRPPLRNRIKTASLDFLNNVAKTTANASIVTGLYAAIDKPALERENKKIEAENARLPEDQRKPLNQIASVEDTFYSSLRMFAGLDAVGALRRAWSIGVRGDYERNKHVRVHFDKFDKEALEKAFGKNPNSLLRQIVFGNVDGVPAKWFEIDPEAEREIYKELGRELTPAEKEAYATYGFTELRKVILNKDIPWATRAKIVSVITGRVVQEPPVAKATIDFVMDKSGTVAKRIIVRSLDMEGNVIQAREFDGQREFEAARSLYESLNDRGWRNNAMLCGNLVIDAIEDKTYADTVDEMAREKGIAPDQFEQMVFGIKQKDITGEKVTYQERQLVDEFDKRHQEKQKAEMELSRPSKLFEQVAREVFGAEWKRAYKIPEKSWGKMTQKEKEFVNRYIDRMGAMGVAERNKLMNANPDWARTAKEYEESVRRRMAEAERPAEAEPLPVLEDEKVSVEVPAEERVEPVPEVIELEEEPGKEQPTQSAVPQDTPTPVEERPAEPAAEEKPQQAGMIGFEPVEQPTERERFDAERKAKAATITDADIEANREALGIPEGTELTDETRQIYAEDLAEDLMRYERYKRGESDEKARFHDYWESKFNPKRQKLEKPVEKHEEPVEQEEPIEEEVTESDALIEQLDNLKGSSDLEKYRHALKVFAGDDEIMGILEDLEPRDITEWVSSFLGLDSGKGYSMLWESKKRNGNVIAKGFKEESGWSWNDAKGFAFMFDNKNGMSPRRVAEKIWENLPSGMKSQYSDVDVFNIMMDLFKSSSRKSDLTNYIRNNRIEQVRDLLNRRRSDELAEIARYKERMSRGEEEPVAEPVTPDESSDEFAVREDDVAPFSLLSLNHRDGEVESGTVRSRARTRKQIGTIAKALGYKIRWVADKSYNAKIDTDEKVLYLNIRTDMPLEAVMGHEVTHDLRKNDPEAYETLKRYAKDLLGQEQWDSEVKGVTEDYNEEYKRRGWEPIRADKAEEEVVCDTMGKLLHSRKGLRELAGSLDPGVAGKVYRLLKGITDTIKHALDEIGDVTDPVYREHDYSTMDSALQEFLEAVKQRAKKGVSASKGSGESQFMLSTELDKRYPNWLKDQLNEGESAKNKGGHSTQVNNTVGTYTKIGQWLKSVGKDKVRILDASSGMGYGTEALREMGFDVEDVEPYPGNSRKNKPTYTDYGQINGGYDVVISNAVLNVIPDDWRADVLRNMAKAVKPGGKIIINTRPAENLRSQKQKIELDNDHEILVTRKNGTVSAYQRGYEGTELVDWAKEILGDGWQVEKATNRNSGFSNGNAAIVVTAPEDKGSFSIDPSGGYSVTDKADIESLAPRMDGESEAAYTERIGEIEADERAFVDGDGQFSLKREDTMRDNSVKYFEEYHVRGNKDRKYGPLRRNSITRQALDKANEMIAEMRDYIAPWYDREAGGNRYLPEEVYGLSTIFDNASYGATLENTLICTRTLAYNDFCDSVKRKLGRPLTKRESFLASQMLYDIATDPQCLYCYVSLDRKAYDEYLLRYFDERDAVIERYNKMADKSAENIDALYKTFLDGRKDTYQMRSRFNSWLMLADHDSAIGRDKVALSSDRKNALAQESNEEAAVRWRDITKQYNRLRGEEKKQFKQSKEYLDALHAYLATEQGQIKDACAYAQGASWTKKEAEYRSYTGELLRTTKRMLGGLASHYGLRFYSFSEYSPAFILENMQMIRDAALRGLKGFAYTKEIDFCKIFLPTGININCSTYGRRNAAGEIVMDERQGANWDEARALRDQYENMGIVFVATDDEMVRWAKEQPWIDVIIPFHIVRTGADIAEFYGWTNYTNVSADYDAQGRHKDIMPPEHNNSIEDYDRLVAERGLTRRFPQFYDGPGDQNYMKLINETRRKASDTPILTPVFNMEEAKKSFDRFVEKGGYWGGFYEVGADDVVRAVDEVVSDIEAGKSAGEVEYGRQDIDFDSAMANLEKTRRRINRNREHGNTPKTSFSLKRKTHTDADGNEVYTETREDGTKDREITTYGDGSKKALWYDDKGNLKERLDYFPDGEVSQVANYDNSGNMTRHIQYDENRHITSYWLPAIGTDWKLDENGVISGKSNGVKIEPYNFQFSLKREAQTHSENFKNWFGDWENDPENASKVVDSDGRPLVVYHQTNAKRWINRETGEDWEKLDWRKKMEWENKSQEEWEDAWEEQDFYTFDDRYARQSIEMPAIFFSPENDPHHEYGNRTIAVYLNMRNPAINPDIPNRGVTDTAGRDAMEALKAQGYDGFIRTDEDGNIREYGVFDSNQVKSADENNGDFDPNNPDIRFSLKRRRNRDDYTDEDRADAAIIANTYLAQADALRQQIETDREREHQLVEERNRLLAFEYPAADPADRPAIMDRINDLRSRINDLRNANYENNTKLRSMDYEYRVAKEILEQGAVTDEEAARFDAGQMTREEKVLEQLFKAAADSRADKKAKQKAIRGLVRELTAITDNFKAAMKARGIESQRKQYDKGTVDHIIRLAKAMMGTGYIDGMTSYEVKRLMGMINNAATRESIETQAGRIVDMMLDHQIRTLRNDFNKQLKVTGQKTNSSGVQVQAGLDQEGQVVMEAMRKSMQIIADSAGERYDSNGYLTEWGEFYEKTLNDMGDEDPVKAEQARKIFEGVWLASKWYEDVRALEINGRILRSQMEDFKASNKPDKTADKDTKRRYADVLADYQEMLRQNKIKIIEAYERMTGDVGMTQADSMRRAKEFADKQKRRVEEIQHNANSDLQDVDDNTQVETPESRVLGANKNNVIARLLFASAGTYEKFMRFFGRMAPNGEGYLFKRFMTQYTHARQNYWKGRHSAFEEMDRKMAEVFGKKKMHWSDIYEMVRDHKKFPPITVSYWDGYRNGQPRLRMDELNQSEALYLYMINKMPDGRMKLRHMGITDDVVQQMAGQIDNKLITLADWLQGEFLPKMRVKYNETHKRVFGADMAAIEDYFPLRVNKLSVASDMDITERDMNDNKPSTITGAIVKRRVNTLPIDLHTDAFDVALSHIDEMEHWSAYAEFNRDNNTLVNYKRFRTKVNNMRSLELGAGNVLWKNFTDAVAIATDAYHPRAGSRSGDHYATRVARFVSTAKIALRSYTALKQLLSIPAFWADSDPLEQMKATVNVANTWQWAIENLPGFAERWQSRQAGNIKLANYNDLSGLRRRKAMQRLGRAGMWANAAIDGLACALGGKAVYETKLKRYRKMGYDEARAQEKALIDAAIAYNNSQQSSEGAYVSPLQVDRTWFANAFSVFRSASMGYTRRMNTSLRQLRNAAFKPGYGAKSVEFLKKQMMRDGLTEEQAEKWAHKIYRRANLKAAASVAIFGQILPFTWNLGANMFYLLFGDDNKEKGNILADSFRHSFFGPVEGLTGGNVISELGDIAADTAIGNIWGDSVWGDSEAYKTLGYREFSTMPLSSDLSSLLKYFARDEVKAANEVVNILFQVATGVNPQTITDWATAILDLSRSDMERRDIAMFAMRLLSTPQSQLDKFYLDQMNISQEQADKMSVDDLIKRYATYKRWRETPLTGWMYSDEREKEVEEKFQKRYEEMLEERSVAEDGLRGAINDIKDLPRKRTMMQKLQKELTDSIEAADPELYKKALEGEKADDDEYVRHVTDKDVEQMAELTMKKKALRAARDRKVKADKDAEAGRITQEEYDAIYKECAHQWKLYNYLNNTLPKKLKEWKLKMEPDMQDKYTPEQVMDTIRSKTDKALRMRPEDMKMKKGDKKKVKKHKKK